VRQPSIMRSHVLDTMDPGILYSSALPFRSGLVSRIQGFSRERLELDWVFDTMIRLPATYYELLGPIDMVRGLRACGVLGWRHLPIRVDRLVALRAMPHHPLWVVFSADKEVAEIIAVWQSRQLIKPLHVSTTGVEGSILPDVLDIDRLRKHCLKLSRIPGAGLGPLGALVKRWRTPAVKLAPFPFRGHLTVEPNQMSLVSNGMKSKNLLPHWQGKDEQEYADAIFETTSAVLTLHREARAPPGVRLTPPRPNLWLVAPSYLPDLRRRLLDGVTEKVDEVAIGDLVRRLQRQRDFKVSQDARALKRLEASPQAQSLHQTRRRELGLFTEAVGWAAAATMAAVCRMRPSVNQVTGKVRQFAENIRSEASTPPHKVRALFEEVQSGLAESLDPRAITLIETVEWGIKVVSDAPVEWLPVGNLPLGLAKDVSRITATPADLLLRQLETHEWLRIGVNDFSEILVASAFAEGDDEDWITRLIATVPPLERVKIRVVRVASENELIRALNSYDGPLMIFDGHGAHPLNGRAHLKVGTDEVEIARLDGRVRMPPIVMLSACDTHAAARSTQTVANAMLQLGARTVLATSLPVRFTYAALIAVRLILSIESYLPVAAARLGRVLKWSEFIGRMLRQQFLLEVLGHYVARGSMDEEISEAILDKVSHLADRSLENALAALEEELADRGISDPAALKALVRDLVPQSDVIRYVQLGNPETITIGSIEDLSEEMRGTEEDQAKLTPKWRFDKARPANVADMMELTGQTAYGPWVDAPDGPGD
jgi:hypothetical protein